MDHEVCTKEHILEDGPPLKKSKTESFGSPICEELTQASIADKLLEIEADQCGQLLALSFSPPYVYNPISYAAETHRCFVQAYGNSEKRILFLGMNPGPFGMAQTGVPFGDIVMTRDWLKISGHVKKPHPEHPKRPIMGLDCPRREVSGTRFWSLMKELSEHPLTFFRHCYVHNYCPLCFMAESGKNVTPVSLRVCERRELESVCDRALVKVVELLGVEWVVCVGSYVEKRANKALHDDDVKVCRIMHPSPVNPLANKGWAEAVKAQLSVHELTDIIRGQR